METYEISLKSGINATKEFERKRLASYSVNVGLRCDNGCCYCSTPSLICRHRVFKSIGRSPFDPSYALIDPSTPQRVARDARRKRKRGMIQLCTIVDAWSPAARRYDLGRRCLEAILSEPEWTVRVLTKNAEVADDFDWITRFRDRVTIGLSVTATPDKQDIMKIIEPNASTIPDRIAVMTDAHRRGLRTYAMFCPLLPGIANSPDQIDELIDRAEQWGCEEIFVEPVNQRGPALRQLQETLADHGYFSEAAHIEAIRSAKHWSQYVVRLFEAVRTSMYKRSNISKLRFLLYGSRLSPDDRIQIESGDEGVIWL